MALLGSSWSLLGRSGPKMDPKMVPKVFKNIVKNLSKKISKMGALLGTISGFNFSLNRDRRAKAFSTRLQILSFVFFSFSLGFGPLWVPLGSLLGSLEALLGCLWTQKRVKTQCFLMVLKRQFFGLWSSWWPSVFILTASWANLVPRWGFKMGTKSGKKRDQKIEKQST